MTRETGRRVVVTGIGVISAAGCSIQKFWSQLLAGRSAIGPVSRFDASAYPSRIAAEVKDTEWEGPDALPPPWREQGRIAWYAAAAAARALESARVERGSLKTDRCGVAMAAGMGRYGQREAFRACAAAADREQRETDWARVNQTLLDEAAPRALDRRTPGSIAAQLAATHGFAGPVQAVMTACAGGTQAIGDGARWIRHGLADVVLAGGSDSEIYPMGLAMFSLLGALSRRNDEPARASRPFDAGRDGFVIGEGAAVLVLESLEHARARRAPIVAEVAGFGAAADAWRVTDPHPDGAGAVLAMRRALAQARREPEHVDYVNAHGTSTLANDRSESRAIRAVLGARADHVPVSSIKGVLGHATVAAGALEAAATALTIAHSIIPPTANLETPDPECTLDYVPGPARPQPVQVAMSNSFAFGGQAAVLVLSHPDA
jgi:3-oxoacyl-[acyl-carrier-protein] synthase II